MLKLKTHSGFHDLFLNYMYLLLLFGVIKTRHRNAVGYITTYAISAYHH